MGEEALEIGEAVDHPFTIAIACRMLGSAYVCRGDPNQAIQVLERALEIGRATHLPLIVVWTITEAASADALAGRVSQALSLLEPFLAEGNGSRVAFLHTLGLARLGEVYLLAGRGSEAGVRAERALMLAREYQQRGNEAYALRLLSAIAAQADPPEVVQAESYYHQALALAEELGMRPLAAHCHLGLGTLYQQVDWAHEAQAELRTAADMYRAMEMTFWLERAEAALATPSG